MSRTTTSLALLLCVACVVACGESRPPAQPAAPTDASARAPKPDPTPVVATESAWRPLVSSDGGFALRWRPTPDPIPSLDPFSIEVEVFVDDSFTTPLDGGELLADAAMPHHGHGMNVRPRTTRLGPGRYRVDAMLFHMGGRWELFFDRIEGGAAERAQTTVVLP